MSEKKNKAYITPHTHWDMEWRYPIWQSRVLLIKFMQELLGILGRDENYRCFLMDGQTAPIDDYLEVMPQDREKVEKYIASGRVSVGPWYTLPDLYPIDGECLIRNLLCGKSRASSLGACLNIGYNSFGWGQTAQFPQIYAGFGFDFIVCAKKVSIERAPESEFMWQSPDGTSILTTRLGEHARANFYFNTYLYAKYGINCMSSEFRYIPENSGAAIHNASPGFIDEDFFVTRPKLDYNTNWLIDSYEGALNATNDTVQKDFRLFLNGTDFSTPQSQITNMINDLNAHIPDTEFTHARLQDYAEGLHRRLDKSKLRTIIGELRDGPSCDCSGNALASRMYLKIKNKKAQNILLRAAEPLNTALYALGGSYPEGMLKKAWGYMLKSHPHDSINGVTQDKTANDVEYRLGQAIEIGQSVTSHAIENLVKRLDLSGFSPNSNFLFVYNPNPWPIHNISEVNIATAASDCIWSLKARALDGTWLETQEISRGEKPYPVHDTEARPWPFISHRHLFYIDTGLLPAMGYKIIELLPEKHFNPEAFYWLPMRRATPLNILKSNNVLENAYLRAEFKHNGSIRLTHKESGHVYDNIHYFEDSGDVGNYWAYYPPYNNQSHTTLMGSARLWSENSGPLSATIVAEYSMVLPESAEEPDYGVRGPSCRSGPETVLKIISRFTLSRGSKRLEVTTRVNNNVKNHRLRLALPTGIKTDTANAAGHFTVDSRPRVNQQAPDGSYWPEMQTLPMQDFVDINGNQKGLAFLSNCFTEYELANDEDNTLYLTLFRAMGGTIVTWWEAVGRFESQEGSQLQRGMEFSYAIYPHSGNWADALVYREAQSHATLPLCYQLCGNAGAAGGLPLSCSFLSITNPNTVISAFKPAENGKNIILRLYNPTNETQHTEINAGFNITKAWQCMLNENRLGDIAVYQNSFSIDMPKQKIITFEIQTT